MFKRKKIGLALSGGGARGIAHIGVLKVFEESNIPIDMIAGTSIGAVVGAFYSAEPNAKKLEKETLELDWKNLFDYTIPRRGFIKGHKIEVLFEKKLSNISFKQLKIPLFVTSFDIGKKREIIFSKGSVARAVRASISVPGLFIPIENNKRILVDGAVFDPVPTEILKQKGADIIIAVNVNFMKIKKPLINREAMYEKSYEKIPNILENVSTSFQIMGAELSRADLIGDKADFVINVNLENVGTMDFSGVKRVIKRGEMATKRSLKAIRKMTNNPFTNFLNELDEGFNVKKIVKSIKENV